MKLWLDDVRPPPDESWHWAKTLEIAFIEMSCNGPNLELISFDHDLGTNAKGETLDSMAVAKLLESLAYQRVGKRIPWQIHSANPVGRKNLQAALESADRYWHQWENMK